MDFQKISTAYATMARSAVPKLFWARPKTEFGKHRAAQASKNVRKKRVAWMMFARKLPRSFLISAIYS